MRIEVENDQIRARKKQEYEDLVAQKEKEGLEARLEKISVLAANLLGIAVMIVVAAISYPLFVAVNGPDSLEADRLFGFSGPICMSCQYSSMILSMDSSGIFPVRRNGGVSISVLTRRISPLIATAANR